MKQSFLVTPVLTLSFLTKDCISKKRNFSISIPGSRIKGIDEKCFLSHRALFNALNNNTNLFTISNFRHHNKCKRKDQRSKFSQQLKSKLLF